MKHQLRVLYMKGSKLGTLYITKKDGKRHPFFTAYCEINYWYDFRYHFSSCLPVLHAW
jgi:hypothetical protein